MVAEFTVGRLTEKAVDGLLAQMASAFGRIETRRKAREFVGLLLEPVARKNGWQMAERAGLRAPITLQKLLSTDKVDADLVRDAVRATVLEALADEDAALILDDTGFVKKGTKSVGVHRQYSGTAGKTENCQIAIFLAYASSKGHALIDRARYLPKAWTDDPERRREARIPVAVAFATKPQQAVALLEAAMAAGAKARWRLGDAIYGVHDVMDAARRANLGYVLGITSKFSCGWASAQQMLEARDADVWKRLSTGAGSKGERLFDWAAVHEWPMAETEGWTRRVIARRTIDDPEDIHYFVVRCPKDMDLAAIARIAGRRSIIEECFRTAKQKAGLADYEVRTWDGLASPHRLRDGRCGRPRSRIHRCRPKKVTRVLASTGHLAADAIAGLVSRFALARRPPSIRLIVSWFRWKQRHQDSAAAYHKRTRHQGKL